MSYKTYDILQEVDNTFFKQIPKHWNIFKLKYIINSLESGKRKDFESEDYAFSLGGEHINWDGTLNLKNKRYISKDFYNSMSKGKIQENDTLLVKDGATIGKTAFVNNLTQKMAVNEHVFIIRNNHLLIPKLLYYLIASNLGFAQIKLTETGSAQGGISQDILDKVRFAIPNSLQEQQQIVNYLDKKTAKIDATIAKNEELIQLLEEKRVALINQVVTKGLNPNAPMKDSGVNWIGEIPEHWEVNRLKFLITKDAQYGANCEPETDETKFDYRYVRITDIDNDASLKDTLVYLSKEDAKGFILHEGDILFARSGATVGKTYLYNHFDGKCCFAGYLIRYIPNKQLLNPKFLLYFSFSKSYSEWIKIVSTQATIQNVSADKYDNLIISIPNIEEQNEIVSYLDKKISNITKIISTIKQNIFLLEEYKTSLIHHVVTGKIDVRGEEI